MLYYKKSKFFFRNKVLYMEVAIASFNLNLLSLLYNHYHQPNWMKYIHYSMDTLNVYS